MDDEESVLSEVPTKSACGALDKHCITGKCGGKLIRGNNWYRHNEYKHSYVVVSYKTCVDKNSTYCKQGKYKDFVPGLPLFCTNLIFNAYFNLYLYRAQAKST